MTSLKDHDGTHNDSSKNIKSGHVALVYYHNNLTTRNPIPVAFVSQGPHL